MTTKDVHTQHCCWCGCKYGDKDCSVAYGPKQPSFPCSECVAGTNPEDWEIPTLRTTELVALWTEHDAAQNSWWEHHPSSAEISPLTAGQLLVSTGPEGSHFVLRVVGTLRQCQEALDRFHLIGWDEWLLEWKAKQNESDLEIIANGLNHRA